MREIQVPDINLKDKLSKCRNMEDIIGKNGGMQRLFGGIIEQFLDVEMDEHLQRERYERSQGEAKNYRNGYSKKTIKTSYGELDIDIPRDRNGEFQPKIIKKHETVITELDKKIIGLYARGMSTSGLMSISWTRKVKLFLRCTSS